MRFALSTVVIAAAAILAVAIPAPIPAPAPAPAKQCGVSGTICTVGGSLACCAGICEIFSEPLGVSAVLAFHNRC